MSTARVIVTRPASDARLWTAQLEHAGIAAEAIPLIDIAPLSGPADAQALNDAWRALDGYAACMFVSAHAVEQFFKEKRLFAQSGYAKMAINNVANDGVLQISPDVRFMAPGPGTVAALRGVGVPASHIDSPAPDASQFDSEALWQVIGGQHWSGRNVLIVRGQSAGGDGASAGRDWIVRQWQGAGASVDFVSVYQRCAPGWDETRLRRVRQAGGDGSVWLFSSSEAVANLVGLAELQGMDWRHARAIATHPRIAQAVRAAGWGVVVESRPALADIRLALGSVELRHP